MAPQNSEAESLQFGDVQPIAIELIIRTPALQPRADISSEVVEQYASDMQSGYQFPPVLLVRVDYDVYEVADGNTTIAAVEKLGYDTVRARVAQGKPGDALEYGHTIANRTHGQPLTKADKRKRFDWMDSQPKFKAMSANQLAPLVGVDRRTIDRWRRGEADPGQCPTPKVQPLRIWNGDYWNGEGRDPRPAWIAQIAEPYRKCRAILDQILFEMEEQAADPIRGVYLRDTIARVRRYIRDAKELLRSVEPAAICPRCSGGDGGCGECRYSGYLPYSIVEKNAATG